MARRPVTPVRPACSPTGDLSEPARCEHGRPCTGCGEVLHLRPVPEVPGVHAWGWRDDAGESGTVTYPWGAGPEPAGWWERLAECDVALYSALVARDNLGMLAKHHAHTPGPCGYVHEPVEAPWCCRWPMWQTVEGWRCREQRTLVPFVVSAAA